jgi:hypothetical protein
VVDLLPAAGASQNAHGGALQEKAAHDHPYRDIGRLLQDIEGADFEGGSIRMRFECEVLAVACLRELQFEARNGRWVLLNHIVLVKWPATNEGTEQTLRIEALTCLEYMKRRWGSLGEKLLRDISSLCIMGSGSQLRNGKGRFNYFSYSLRLKKKRI